MKIGVFYHCLLSARHRVIEEPYAMNLILEQMSAMDISGLVEAADEVSIYVNGNPEETAIVASVAPDKAKVHSHGPEANSEIPTLQQLRIWCEMNPDSVVLYHHTKGVSTPRQADNWRLRMETYMVWNWKDCVDRFKNNVDAIGCHWLTPEANPGAITSPFFGGNFWWARTNYIKRLPPLPPDTWENRYEGESWIGRGIPRPIIFDPSPGWPTL